jgi:hypothetical protein
MTPDAQVVLAAWLSPSHDTYVGPKMKRVSQRLFAGDLRVQ